MHARNARTEPRVSPARAAETPDLPKTGDDHRMTAKIASFAGHAPRRPDAATSPYGTADDVPVTILKPTTGWARLRLGELWEFRELVFFFIWRDVKVRYKQTALGAAWAILQPLLTMIIFSIFFGRLAKMPSDGLPYPLFALAGLVPWLFFMNGLTLGSNSLVANERLIKKVFFPRMIMPIASILAGLVDLLIAFALLAVAMAYYGVAPTPMIVLVPVFIAVAAIAVTGATLWLSALNVQYRDVRYVVPFLAQIWMFATPIAYPSSLLSESWRVIYALNPMVGVVEGIRWSLLGAGDPPLGMFVVSAATAVAMLISGAFYFRRVERSFADIA